MTAQTLTFIILSGIVALCAALFQYFYKNRIDKRLKILFSVLRFISLFALFLLLVNPKIDHISYITVKPILAVAVDNSASIENLESGDGVRNTVNKLIENAELKERFDVDLYQFDESLDKLDSLNFTASRTDIAGPISSFQSIYKQKYVPLLITDGNATLGRDYSYVAEQIGVPTYMIAVGDTLQYEDLSLERININRYAYLDNEFPVELILKYTGDQPVKTKLNISSGNKIIKSETVTFSKNERGKLVTLFLPAKTVGINQYNATLQPLDGEKNTANNTKNFAVEVIDQKAKIAIVYSYMHPDLGAYKKAIESNRLREVTIVSISDFDVSKIDDYDLLLLFEPSSTFAKVYNVLKKTNANRFTILADQADYNFLNSNQNTFSKQPTAQSDQVRPEYNPNFSAFLTEELEFSDFPPVISGFGQVQLSGDKDVLLFKNIGGLTTDDPLLAITEIEGRREVLFMAKDIWQWRAQSYVNSGSFEKFDAFMDKLVQYAAAKNKRTRLRVDYDAFYYGADNSIISAQYMDATYVFDPNARLILKVKKKEENTQSELPLILKGNRYEVNLNPLDPGDYDFTVQVEGEGSKSSGSFTIIAYDVERQAQNADWQQIKATADLSGGLATSLSNQDELIDALLKDTRYLPVQKEIKKSEPLISFTYLLFIIAAALALEWFIRKYNGLL